MCIMYTGTIHAHGGFVLFQHVQVKVSEKSSTNAGGSVSTNPSESYMYTINIVTCSTVLFLINIYVIILTSKSDASSRKRPSSQRKQLTAGSSKRKSGSSKRPSIMTDDPLVSRACGVHVIIITSM